MLTIASMMGTATATTFRAVSVEELYGESDLVVSGVIESGAILPKGCGVSYQVRVDRSFKGEATSGSLVTFRKYGPMQVGSRYFLFMSKPEKEFNPITSTNSRDMNMRAEHIQRCMDVQPPFTVNIWGNGALKVSGTYNDSVKKAVFFDNIVITPPERLATTTLKPRDRYDNDRIGTAMELEMFSEYLSELAASK
jgi:hypothetical protein